MWWSCPKPPVKKSHREAIYPAVQDSHGVAIDPAVQGTINSTITSKLENLRSVMAKEVADQINKILDARPVYVLSAEVRPRDGLGSVTAHSSGMANQSSATNSLDLIGGHKQDGQPDSP